MSAIIIGIAGGSGSGKTTLTRHLKEHFGENVTVIGHDSYYTLRFPFVSPLLKIPIQSKFHSAKGTHGN